MSIPLSLSGKVALISGGSRGIGAATVRMFTAAGARVMAETRRSVCYLQFSHCLGGTDAALRGLPSGPHGVRAGATGAERHVGWRRSALVDRLSQRSDGLSFALR